MANIKSLAKLIAEKSKRKSPPEDFLHMLEEAIVRLDRQDSRTPSRSFKPSSLGGCLRKVFYEIEGVPPEANDDRDASSVGITESGTDRHERIQKAITQMKDLGYPVEWVDVEEYLKKRPQKGTRVVSKKGMETKLFNDVLKLSFMCDGIFLMHGAYYVLEIKTEASMKWQGRTDPEDNHLTQASCYSACLGIDRVMYLYENRDICRKKVMLHVVSEEEKFERVISPIETVNSHVLLGTIPSMTDKQKFCRYCNYKSRCKKDGAT